MTEKDENDKYDANDAEQAQFDAQFEQLISGLNDLDDIDQSELDEALPAESNFDDLDTPVKTEETITTNRARVVFLTPLASAEALAGLCVLSGIELVVVPTEAGAAGILELSLSEESFGMALIADTLRDFDPSVSEIAKMISEITRFPVVVLAALLTPGTEQEPGVTGQVLAGRWNKGEFDTDLPSGLVLVQLPLKVEDLLLARVEETDTAGAVETRGISRLKAFELLRKGTRKPGQDKK